MIRSRTSRLVGVIAAGLLALMTVGIGSVTAANPDWDITIVPTPAKVGAGKDAGFIITVANKGPSNVNDLRVIVTPGDTPDAEPTYLSDLVYAINGSATCIDQSPLTCLLGSLEDDESVTFTVAYAVPAGLTGNFDLNVAIRAGTGDPDGNNNSRGDKFAKDSAATIGSGNFDGGFVVGADTYQTNPSLGNRNIQSTALSGAQQHVPVTIEDGIATIGSCDSALDDAACTGLFGEWSKLNVNNGNGGVLFGTPFKVTLMVRGGPGGGADGDIQAVHVLDNNTIDVIDEPCTFVGTDPIPTNPECLVPTKVGNIWMIDVWLLQNGFVRGGI